MLWKTVGIVLLVSFGRTVAIKDTQDLISVHGVKRTSTIDKTRPRREETSTDSSDCTGEGFFSACNYMKFVNYLSGYLGGSYRPPEPSGGGGYSSGGGGSYGRPQTTTPVPDRPEEENSTTKAWDGSYSWKFYVPEGEILAEESGIVDQNVPEGPGTVVRGSYSFSAPDGSHFRVTYTADERGFLPSGDHLPTSPPIPEAILKALSQNAADEEAGIFDDGSYKEGRG